MASLYYFINYTSVNADYNYIVYVYIICLFYQNNAIDNYGLTTHVINYNWHKSKFMSGVGCINHNREVFIDIFCSNYNSIIHKLQS